jgi:hypothetical protein
MKRISLIAAVAFLAPALWASEQCVSHETKVIDSEARCVDSGGISIGFTEDEGIKVACMQDPQVRGRCGPDGSLTRLRAYSSWFNKLKQFQDSCASEGGTFAYQDARFAEPTNESFCLQAVPEVGSSMFEEPLCNYRSVCPAVAVTCDRPCADHTFARLY